jgi:hypothetical protein
MILCLLLLDIKIEQYSHFRCNASSFCLLHASDFTQVSLLQSMIFKRSIERTQTSGAGKRQIDLTLQWKCQYCMNKNSKHAFLDLIPPKESKALPIR